MKTLIFALLALVALAGLFVALKPQPEAAGPNIVAMPVTKFYELTVRDKKIVYGDPMLKVTQGDVVTLRITSDKTDELHLHGYDLSLHLKADVPGELKFTANRSGRFDYELHHSHVDLGALEVTPR